MDEAKLREKLGKIEALFAGATTEGERVAAGEARRRIQMRLETIEKTEPLVEYKFTLADTWSRKVFMALLRRYDLKPCGSRRGHGQRGAHRAGRDGAGDEVAPRRLPLCYGLGPCRPGTIYATASNPKGREGPAFPWPFDLQHRTYPAVDASLLPNASALIGPLARAFWPMGWLMEQARR